MECAISPENARTLDRVLGSPTIKTVALSTLGSVTLQARLENASLYTNVVLSRDFFVTLAVGGGTAVEFPKPRFHVPDMEALEMRLQSHFVELRWRFRTHTLTRVLCLSHAALRGIAFDYAEGFELEGALVQEVVRQLEGNEVTLSFGDRIVFSNAGAPEGSSLGVRNASRLRDVRFSVLRRNLRAVAEGAFEKYDFLIDRDERRLSVCAACDGIAVTHLMTLCIE